MEVYEIIEEEKEQLSKLLKYMPDELSYLTSTPGYYSCSSKTPWVFWSHPDSVFSTQMEN